MVSINSSIRWPTIVSILPDSESLLPCFCSLASLFSCGFLLITGLGGLGGSGGGADDADGV
jgi:hypothetical protein